MHDDRVESNIHASGGFPYWKDGEVPIMNSVLDSLLKSLTQRLVVGLEKQFEAPEDPPSPVDCAECPSGCAAPLSAAEQACFRHFEATSVYQVGAACCILGWALGVACHYFLSRRVHHRVQQVVSSDGSESRRSRPNVDRAQRSDRPPTTSRF